MENNPAIVKNASSGYGYHYASLADFAKQGIKIPRMRVKPCEGGDYVEYLDDSDKWQIGAKIVTPEMKGMNAAQAYGSALTYARRYTVALAQGIATDDDDAVEKAKPEFSRKSPKPQNVRGSNLPGDAAAREERRDAVAEIFAEDSEKEGGKEATPAQRAKLRGLLGANYGSVIAKNTAGAGYLSQKKADELIAAVEARKEKDQ